jgi:hypothetical protein
VPVLPLDPHEIAALDRALKYWSEHRDWECATLFGLELAEYRAATVAWSQNSDISDPTIALALLGALRELLDGASALKEEKFVAFIGHSKEELVAIYRRLAPMLLDILDSRDTV